MMHPIYLPFTEERLKIHFARVKRSEICIDSHEQHIKYFRESLENYEKCPEKEKRKNIPLSDLRRPCQVEKDEKFWTVSCLMTIYHSKHRQRDLSELFQRAYGKQPPFSGTKTWGDCFKGDLNLFFETNLPSPKSYKKWLRKNLTNNHFIPYILDSDNGRKNLEGATNADAVIINEENGFAVVIEAKVLSDISYQITYDLLRNQISRNIDVMLEKNNDLCPPLNHRDPDKTLFLLITPKLFKQNPKSRLYGYKMNDYMTNPDSIQSDLPHRSGYHWSNISKRLGWLTWEDFKSVNNECCKWLV